MGFIDNIDYIDFTRYDVIDALKPLLDAGWYIHPKTKRITQEGRSSLDHKRKWFFVNPDMNRHCDVYRAIAQSCKFVPQACMDCWKVVVKMETIVELVELLKWQLEFTEGHKNDRFCKCGIEERNYTTYNYGGYFYCKSKAEGLKRHEQVRKGADTINPKIEVILKRYCTEYELDFGATKTYERPPEADRMEKEIYKVLDLDKANPKQPAYLRKHVIRQWVNYAHDKGDMTYTKFTGGSPLFPKLDTYHNEEK